MKNLQVLTNTDILSFDEFVRFMDGNKSSRFVSVVYKAKGTGEVARHTVLLNVDRNRCLKVDLANLQKLRPTLEGLDGQAADELIKSLTDSLSGFNPRYTKHGYYEGQGNGNVQESVKSVVYIRGMTVKKDVLVKGTYKEVKSKPLTLAKNNLSKEFKSSRVREFIVNPDNFKVARHNGKSLVVDLVGDLEVAVNNPVVAVNQGVAVPA